MERDDNVFAAEAIISSRETEAEVGIKEELLNVEKVCSTPRQVCLERIKTKGQLSLVFVNVLRITAQAWERHVVESIRNNTKPLFCYSVEAATNLSYTLILLLRVIRLDQILGQEIAIDGGHVIVMRLVQYIFPKIESNSSSCSNSTMHDDVHEDDQDAINDLSDLVFSIASCFHCIHNNSNNSKKTLFFTNEERIQRLPLSFCLPKIFKTSSSTTTNEQQRVILFQQVPIRQSSQVDVGFVMWPSAVILSYYIATNTHLIQNCSVLELGSGCGLTGLVAGAIGAKSVIQTDYNDIVLENLKANISLNDDLLLSNCCTVSKLDFYMQRGESPLGGWSSYDDGSTNPPVSIVLAADVICKPSDSVAVSKTIYDCLEPSGKAYVISANAKHRFGVDSFENECRGIGLGVKITTISSSAIQDEHSDNNNMTSLLNCCSGYVAGMEFILFELTKPSIVTGPSL